MNMAHTFLCLLWKKKGQNSLYVFAMTAVINGMEELSLGDAQRKIVKAPIFEQCLTAGKTETT